MYQKSSLYFPIDMDVYLFDEPLSNLDAELRVEMRQELARLHRETGATMLHVTHDQVEAMTLVDRIVIMNNGRIEQQGSPEELYDDPDSVFVAGFLAWTIHEMPNSFTEPFSRSEFSEGANVARRNTGCISD